jgi:hypothetical protein
MHDTQKIGSNHRELCASFEDFFGDNSINLCTEIDFDSIKIETECLKSKDKKESLDFIGDEDESTEIDSIISPLNMTITSLKLSSGEENTETEEILTILKQKSPKFDACRKSDPDLFTARRVSLYGKVLQCESSGKDSECRTPLPIRPRCVPHRVSNPFHRNFEITPCINNLNTNKANNEKISRVNIF